MPSLQLAAAVSACTSSKPVPIPIPYLNGFRSDPARRPAGFSAGGLHQSLMSASSKEALAAYRCVQLLLTGSRATPTASHRRRSRLMYKDVFDILKFMRLACESDSAGLTA